MEDWSKSFRFRTSGDFTFGVGTSAQVGAKAKEFDVTNALVVTDPGVAKAGVLEGIKASLQKAGVAFEVYDQVLPEPTVESVDKCVEAWKAGSFSGFIAVGGGSSIDTSKAANLVASNGGVCRDYFTGGSKSGKANLPLIALPTTSGTGSENTGGAVIKDEVTKFKGSVRFTNYPVKAAITDPLLTMTVPTGMTAGTGMDVICHALEAYLNSNFNPLANTINFEAIRVAAKWLPVAVARGNDVMARTMMSYASTTAGMGFSNKGNIDVHGLGMAFGGQLNVPHGIAVAMILPYILRDSLIGCQEEMAHFAELVGEKVDGLSTYDAAVKGIDFIPRFTKSLGIPQTLREVGATSKDCFDQIAKDAVKLGPRPGPRLLHKYEDFIRILEAAY